MSDLLIPLGTTDTVAVIDSADAELVLAHRWTRRSKHDYWYAIEVNGCCAYSGRFLHNVIMGTTYVDHIDGDGLNNRRANLRRASHEQNNRNRRAWGGTSAYKGVSRHFNRWVTTIRIDGLSVVTRHDTEAAAAQDYDRLARETRGQFGRYNFPLPGEQSALRKGF